MSEASRIDATQAFQKSRDGSALLVCAYDDDEKCEELRLTGALNFSEFKDRLEAIPKDQQIIFYCA